MGRVGLWFLVGLGKLSKWWIFWGGRVLGGGEGIWKVIVVIEIDFSEVCYM